MAKRDSVHSLANFKAAIALNDEYKEALTGLGYAYLLRNSYKESYAVFNDLSLKYEQDETILLGKANSLTGLSRYKEALDIYTKLTAKNPENVDALYGVAHVYYLIDKPLLSERTIATISKYNPFHYDTLLLAARIKMDEGRIKEGEAYIKKAINVRQEFPDAYTAYGRLLLTQYQREGEEGILFDAAQECERARLIDPEAPEPIEILGTIAMLHRLPEEAIALYDKVLAVSPEHVSALYNKAIAHELLAETSKAAANLEQGLTLLPDDPLMNAKFETFMIENDYAFGHPGRITRARQHFSLFGYNAQQNLSDYSILHLRKAIVLNPIDTSYRRKLAEYYKASGYNRLYINELKHIERLEPGAAQTEELNIAVIKRRERLYNRKGYANKLPKRDVVRMFVLDFSQKKDPYRFFDSGYIVGENLTFALKQMGKFEVISGAKRERLRNKLEGNAALENVLRELEGEGVDYVIAGDFKYEHEAMECDYRVIDLRSGATKQSFTLLEKGKNMLDRVNFRAALKMYDDIPLQGTIVELDQHEALLNIGSIDGIKEGDIVYATNIYKPKGRAKKVLFEIKEVDTYLSLASLVNQADKDKISVGSQVFYQKKLRSRRIK